MVLAFARIWLALACIGLAPARNWLALSVSG
jgi:hypothetical protein